MEDTDISDAAGLLVPDVNEDSVDIYDGLDAGFSSNTEKSPRDGSELKESMDLYEEIVTEEQRSRETSYSELMSRFQAAQNQIKELRRRLEQMETQNTGLNSENSRLKKNISALLRTARQEVTRKDAEIQRLNQRSQKSHHHSKSHISNLREPNPSSRTSTESINCRPHPPPFLPPPPPHSRLLLPPPPSILPPPPPPPPSVLPPPPPHPASPPSKNQPPTDPPQPSRTETNSSADRSTGSGTEVRASKGSSHSYVSSKSSSRGDCETSDKSKRREDKHQSHKVSESADRRRKTGSYSSKDCHVPDKNRSHKADKDIGRKHESRSCKSRIYLNAEGHHRSDRTKSPPPDMSHMVPSSDDTKGRSREKRQDKAKLTSDSEQSAAHISKDGHSRDHRKIKLSDGHSRRSDSKERKKSSSNHHSERHSDPSKEREGEWSSNDHHRKEERRRENETSKKHKRSASSELNRDHEKRRLKESEPGKVDDRSKDRMKKTHEALKRAHTAEKSSVDENSPNRKLCFMETLNLTLSPIKKPVLPIDNGQEVDKVVESKSDEENSPTCLEDMCVIDEVNSSELEAGCEDHTEKSSDLPEYSNSERTHGKDIQEKDVSLSETAAGKLLEDSSVQTTSEHSPSLDTADSQTAAHLTPQSPESSSVKPTEMDVSHNVSSHCKEDKSEPLEETDGVSDTGSVSKQQTNCSSPKLNPGHNTDLNAAISDPVVVESQVEPPKPKEKIFPEASVEEGATAPSPTKENPVAADISVSPKKSQQSLITSPQICEQEPHPPASFSSIHRKDAKDTDAVSSTISLESLPQEGLSLPEAIYVLTHTHDEANDGSGSAPEPSSSTGCVGVSKVSSTTEEMSPPPLPSTPGKCNNLAFTPKKSCTPGKSHEENPEPSSSVPLLHDEDSMMRTLSNLKKIPDAISPLRSPIRITKRGQHHAHGKPGFVKSLQKDFSSTPTDVNSKKLDVNKENKYPGSPANHDMQNMADKGSDLRASLSDTELEEGEILSESDEAAAGSPVPANKRAKLVRPVRNKPSPKSVFKKKPEGKCVTPKEASESTGGSARSPKSRFKTVCPAASKASFANIEEIMETFKLVRAEIRKKYMKLHKTFPKKSFYGMMDNFQESFLEFVDGAHFGQICSQATELKSKLKKLIATVFSKVSNNGIVKRIFEQQAVDLKQKLWDFVDVQVDSMFKDIHLTLKSLCKPAKPQTQAEEKRPSTNDRISRQSTVKKPQCPQKETRQPGPSSVNRIQPSAVVPYRTGLGSRGKDIRITHLDDRSSDSHPADHLNTQTTIDSLPPKNISSTPEKSTSAPLVVSQSSLLDKTDFELLTEQQASSLTFNLVRDSQMGEIFKCLLQGSDLLENSGITGDSTSWSFGTPRKDGERLISITTPSKYDSPSKLLTPSKFNTPSKLIATWSSISPRKVSSPRSKDQIPLNPAFFDESCLLEVPSENRAMLQSSLASQRSYSILAEDLAVSLTIPSPLKSDSHLSFLQPSTMSIMSTPDSVISAHISEDALLDGEDATEQDIHLALDTDNSSCSSSSSSMATPARTTSFLFKPDMPMQALIMEKSNDHFIVKIRQTASCQNSTLIADESLSRTLTEEDVAAQESQAKAVLSNQSENSLFNSAESPETCPAATDVSLTLTKEPCHKTEDAPSQQSTSKLSLKLSPSNVSVTSSSEKNLHSSSQSSHCVPVQISEAAGVATDQSTSQTGRREKDLKSPTKALKSSSKTAASEKNPQHPAAKSCETSQQRRISLSHVSDSERDGMDASESERLTIAEDSSSMPKRDRSNRDKCRKRKKHQDKVKTKRSRKEEVETAEEMVSDLKKDEDSRSSPMSLSPNSLSAKNVVRKKGEVVIAWTRDEDRAILMELKTKGASRETFSALSEKLNKPSGQIAHRFHQLMKLFKKMDA